MNFTNKLSRPIPHGILTIATAIFSGISAFGIGTLLLEKHLHALKRYKVSGLVGPYLADVFSDPLILTAVLLTTALFVLDLCVTVRAVKREETGSVPCLVWLLLVIAAFLGLLWRFLFLS